MTLNLRLKPVKTKSKNYVSLFFSSTNSEEFGIDFPRLTDKTYIFISRRGRGTDKVPVLGMVQRGGDVRFRMMERIYGGSHQRSHRTNAGILRCAQNDSSCGFSGRAEESPGLKSPLFPRAEEVLKKARQCRKADLRG